MPPKKLTLEDMYKIACWKHNQAQTPWNAQQVAFWQGAAASTAWLLKVRGLNDAQLYQMEQVGIDLGEQGRWDGIVEELDRPDGTAPFENWMTERERLVAFMHERDLDYKGLGRLMKWSPTFISGFIGGAWSMTLGFRLAFAQTFGDDVAARVLDMNGHGRADDPGVALHSQHSTDAAKRSSELVGEDERESTFQEQPA